MGGGEMQPGPRDPRTGGGPVSPSRAGSRGADVRAMRWGKGRATRRRPRPWAPPRLGPRAAPAHIPPQALQPALHPGLEPPTPRPLPARRRAWPAVRDGNEQSLGSFGGEGGAGLKGTTTSFQPAVETKMGGLCGPRTQEGTQARNSGGGRPGEGLSGVSALLSSPPCNAMREPRNAFPNFFPFWKESRPLAGASSPHSFTRFR